MVTAPRLLADKETLQAPHERLQAVDTPDAYGAGIGRALERLGEVGTQVSAEFNRRADEADVRNADSKFQAITREIMLGRQRDPTNPNDQGTPGFLSLRGEDAVTTRIQTEDQLRQALDDLAGGRRSRASQDAFRDLANRRLEDTLGTADRHVLSETRTVEDEAREAQAAESLNTAVANFHDENLAAANINTGINVVTEQADAQGASIERTGQMIRDYQSRAWAQVIVRRANEDPSGAQAIFANRRGKMNAEDINRVESAIHGVVLADRARHEVDRLMTEAHGNVEAFQSAAESIEDTQLRDEVLARGLTQARQREEAEAADTENAEERARTAISRGGLGAVTADDRGILQREGRWNILVNELRERTSRGHTAIDRESKDFADQLESIALDNPQQFHIILDAMRGIHAPGVTEAIIRQASGGLTSEQLLAMRMRMNNDDYTRVRQRQENMRGTGDAANSVLDRTYQDLLRYGEPLAAAQGIDVQAQGGLLTGPGQDQLSRRGQFRAFLLSEARAALQANGGRALSQQDIEGIVNRALMQGNTATMPFTGWRFGDTRRAFEATPQSPVSIPYSRIPDADKHALMLQWRRQNPNAAVREGSQEERAMEQWIENAFARSLAGE